MCRRQAVRSGAGPSALVLELAAPALLELCDAYASATLRCPLALLRRCRAGHAALRGANALLGYVCSPPNTARFLAAHACLRRALAVDSCLVAVQGTGPWPHPHVAYSMLSQARKTTAAAWPCCSPAARFESAKCADPKPSTNSAKLCDNTDAHFSKN